MDPVQLRPDEMHDLQLQHLTLQLKQSEAQSTQNAARLAKLEAALAQRTLQQRVRHLIHQYMGDDASLDRYEIDLARGHIIPSAQAPQRLPEVTAEP